MDDGGGSKNETNAKKKDDAAACQRCGSHRYGSDGSSFLLSPFNRLNRTVTYGTNVWWLLV